MKRWVGFITIIITVNVLILYFYSGIIQIEIQRKQPPDAITSEISRQYVHDVQWKTTELKQQVMLVAYMRSGSSFVGNILQYNGDVFYVFEPLFTLEQYYTSHLQRPITSFHNPPFFLSDVDYEELQNEYVSWVLSCDFENLDVDTLTHIHWIRGKMEPYYDCLLGIWKSSNQTAGRSIPDLKSISRSNIMKCLHFLYDDCNKRKVSLTKLIRYKMENVESLLEKHPTYKIIHLVRDPRAILYSRHRIGFRKLQTSIQNQSKELCDNMYDDVTMYYYLRQKYKNRLKLVRYEDLVENPIEEFQSLYEFINVSFGVDQTDYINNLTDHTGLSCLFCVSNKKATETAHAWRYTIDWDFMKMIEKNCIEVFGYLGYRAIQNKNNLVNHDFKLYDVKEKAPIFK